MPSTLPALFVSHGAPTIVIEDTPARRFLETLGASLPRPSAVLIASAHFEAAGPTLAGAAHPGMIYDFGGFPKPLYEMVYPAPGAPALAERAAALLSAAGFAPRIDDRRGFDHGTWTPLKLMYPDADLPVLQISIDPMQSGQWHLDMGQALAPLRGEGVLIVGSGSASHDLAAFFRDGPEKRAANGASAVRFAEWLCSAIEDGRIDETLDWRAGPDGAKQHPTPDHILPLHVALGAGGGVRRRVHTSLGYGVLSMDAYSFAD